MIHMVTWEEAVPATAPRAGLGLTLGKMISQEDCVCLKLGTH